MNAELLSVIPALVIFCLITTITPGPNNILLAHSGANFGVKKTLPHVLGIRCGMTLLHIAILLGLGQVFKYWPALRLVFMLIAGGYIIYMSVKIVMAKPLQANSRLKPLSIAEAASFQLINPKSWASLMTASSVFTLSGDLFLASALLCLLAFNIATLPGTFMWITVGKLVASRLESPRFYRNFNRVMGALLLTTLPMMFL